MDTTTTYTLISALAGDCVPGVEVSDPDCPIDIRDYPEAMEWAREQGWGEDAPDELIYVLIGDSDEEIPGGFETYRLTVTPPRYAVRLLDPRDQEGALTFLASTPALGVEVTIPRLAEACSLGNIDPQHSGGDAQTAAIEAAMTWPLPPTGTTLVTVRPDPDALGAMAILLLRAAGIEISPEARGRAINWIAQKDKEASGPWPGPRPYIRPQDMVNQVSVLGTVCMDHKTPLGERVEAVRQWLLSGPPAGQESIYHRLECDAARAQANLDVQVVNGVAMVTGSHRLAMEIGYHHAPVVVATNEQFRWQGGPPHRKHTVARWNSAVPMDWDGMLAALHAAEPGWGGHPSIVGSPQGVASTLTTGQVAEIVVRHSVIRRPRQNRAQTAADLRTAAIEVRTRGWHPGVPYAITSAGRVGVFGAIRAAVAGAPRIAEADGDAIERVLDAEYALDVYLSGAGRARSVPPDVVSTAAVAQWTDEAESGDQVAGLLEAAATLL